MDEQAVGTAAESDRIRTGVPYRKWLGDPRQGQVHNGDVVGGGVRPRVTRTQNCGLGFSGGVKEAEQRVVDEGLLPRRGGGFLL
jgi:hypothetical protein